MPLYQLLTDRTLAQSSAITPTTLIHIVYTGDPSQNIAGSSYKAELKQLSSIFSGSTFTGGTVSGATNFTNGLTANTISATTYLNLPTDIRVTGGTYSAGTITLTNNTGGTFNVTGLTTGTTSSVSGNFLPLSGGTVSGATNFTNGLTANTISATTYLNLPTDIRVTGGTYANNTFTYRNNTGGTFNVLFNTVTGLTVNGNLTVTGTTTSTTISATTYQNLPPKEVFYKSHSVTSSLGYFGGFFEPNYSGGVNPNVVFISGIIPYDFDTHISSDIFLISTVSETQTGQLIFSSGSFGTSCSATTGYTTFSKSYTQGIIDTVNVNNFFSGITANEVFSTGIAGDGADKLVIGIKFKYYPI